MQTLFEIDFNPEGGEVRDRVRENIAEFGPGIEDPSFIESVTEGVTQKRDLLDEIIEKAAPDWPVEKIAVVDRNILRLGLYELLFSDHEEVPPKVAINESIELAKSYGGEKSGSFINGVLGAIYKEMGEPGKDQKSKKMQMKDEFDFDSLPIQKKGGAVVFSVDENDVIRLALVHDVFGYWTLSKGSIEENEEEEGTARVIKEEMGIDVEILDFIGENEYVAKHPQIGRHRKQVRYWLARGEFTPLQLEAEPGGLDDTQWFELYQVLSLHMYDNIVEMITKAIEIITTKYLDTSAMNE